MSLLCGQQYALEGQKYPCDFNTLWEEAHIALKYEADAFKNQNVTLAAFDLLMLLPNN